MAIGLRHKCFNTNRNLSKESSKKIRILFSIYNAMNLLHAPNLCTHTQCVFRQLPERFPYCGTTHFIFVSKLGDLLQQTRCNACQVIRHANLMEMKNVTKFVALACHKQPIYRIKLLIRALYLCTIEFRVFTR